MITVITKTLQLETYLYAKQEESGVIGLYVELLGVKQTIFITPGDIQKLYETFCLPDKDPKEWAKMVDPGLS